MGNEGSMPGVSIIIDNYNHDRFVAAAIESALAQTHPKTEVIVIDDGSTDGSHEIIESFGNRIRAIFQANHGQSLAVANALKVARHEIVLILDADDLLEPEAAAAIVRHWGPGIVKIQFCLSAIDQEGNSLNTVFPKYPDELTAEMVKDELFRTGGYPDPPTSGNAFCRTFMNRILPPKEGNVTLDGMLNSAAPLYGQVITIPKALGRYRIHGGNFFPQTEFAVERFDRYIEVNERRFAFLRARCAELDLDLASDALDLDVRHKEHCLVREKFRVAGERDVMTAAWKALRAVSASPYGMRHRAIRVAWILLVAMSPRPVAKRLVEERFILSRRTPWTERLLNFGRKRPLVEEHPAPQAGPTSHGPMAA